MGRDYFSVDRLLRLSERGSAVLEGTIALGMAFLLLTLLVQAAFAMVARNAAQAAVAASARRASRPQADLPAEQAALHALLGDSIPGATGVAVKVTSDSTMARSSASFTWHPPGPGWMPLTIRVRATAPNAVPP